MIARWVKTTDVDSVISGRGLPSDELINTGQEERLGVVEIDEDW